MVVIMAGLKVPTSPANHTVRPDIRKNTTKRNIADQPIAFFEAPDLFRRIIPACKSK